MRGVYRNLTAIGLTLDRLGPVIQSKPILEAFLVYDDSSVKKMDAPTSVRVKPSTSVAGGDRFSGKIAHEMAQAGAGHHQGYTGSNYVGPSDRDNFKIDIDAYDVSMDIAPMAMASSSSSSGK